MSVYKKKRKDGSTAWYYDFSYNGRRFRGVGGSTRTQAFLAQDKVRVQVLNGKYELEQRIGNIKFDVFAEKYLKRNIHLRSYKRIQILVNHLKKFFSENVLSHIKTDNIEDYIASRRNEGLSPATINRELSCLRRMFNQALSWEDALKNPVSGIRFLEEPPSRTRFLTHEEANNLLKCCTPSLRAIVFTALNTGMRLNEVLSLSWDNVFIDSVINPYLEITRTKNNKTRSVPLNDEMVRVIKELEKNKKNLFYVFIGDRGKPLQSLRKPFQKALEKAGIHNFRFHDLRHTFASHFIMSGGDVLTLKEILGHSSLKMVERYAHLASAHKRKQVNNLTGQFEICHLYATSPKSDEKRVAVNS